MNSPTIAALCFFLLMFVKGTTSSRYHKLSEFQAKLKEKQAIISSPGEAPPASRSKQNGRVFYPIGYGADQTGEQESSDAILSALSDAFQVQSEIKLLPGVNDLGGVVVDLQGGNFVISKPIRFPDAGGGNIVVQGGTLRASDAFPSDRYLIELFSPNPPSSQSAGIHYEAITFRDILFDSSYRGGGLYVVDSARIRINNCFFLHFTTQGILVEGGHETFISNTFLGQHSTVGGDKGEKDFSGTAIDLSSNDNAVTDVVVFSAFTGIIIRGQANMITGVHCYNKATYFGGVGILIKSSGSATRIDNSYLDYTAIVIEDPIQVHVTNGFFLGDANVVLQSIKGKISGLIIVNNMFSGDQQKQNPMLSLNGKFTDIDQVIVDQNEVQGMSLKSTVGKQSVAGNGTKWKADFSSILVFPNRINHVTYSFCNLGVPMFAMHAATNVSNNVVVIESDKAVNAVVSVVVDQYNIAGEKILEM